MKIAYCTNVRLPSERAHGHQVAQVCDALSDLGHDVMIFAPFRKNTITESYHAYYDARAGVSVNTLGTFDPVASRMFPGVFGLWMLNWLLRHNLAKELHGFDVLYTRSPALLSTLLATSIPTIVELHRLPRRHRRAFVRDCNRCVLVVCLTSPMREELLRWGVDEGRLIVEGDAVNLARFSSLPARDDARSAFGIAKSTYVAGYAGSLETMGHSKGVEQLIRAVSDLRRAGHDVRALIAGGPEHAVRRLRSLADTGTVVWLGQRKHEDIPRVFAASDILVYTAPASDHPYFLRDTSPLKVFEYMAAGKPIIAADIPPLRDILDADTCMSYRPGDVHGLAHALLCALREPAEMEKRAMFALGRVSRHTWHERMRRILAAAASKS